MIVWLVVVIFMSLGFGCQPQQHLPGKPTVWSAANLQAGASVLATMTRLSRDFVGVVPVPLEMSCLCARSLLSGGLPHLISFHEAHSLPSSPLISGFCCWTLGGKRHQVARVRGNQPSCPCLNYLATRASLRLCSIFDRQRVIFFSSRPSASLC